jgi:hypothetical protein
MASGSCFVASRLDPAIACALLWHIFYISNVIAYFFELSEETVKLGFDEC